MSLLTCLCSRAVHLEVAESLDTDSCINVLRRFVCRRGPVTEMRSDNGTNFIGANRELRAALKELEQSKIQAALQKQDIKWVFNPPLGAHHGGVWERLIRSIKNILQCLFREQALTD